MSLFDYDQSKRINKYEYTFEALIMAAMRKADTFNQVKLKNAFPRTWDELHARYNSPGGKLEPEDTRSMELELRTGKKS